MLNPTKFTECMGVLYVTFRLEANKAMTKMYLRALEDLTDDAFEKAVERALSECKHFPRPAELRTLAGQPGAEGEASAAWPRVLAATGSVGHRRSVDFGAVGNAAVREIGGWGNLCRMQEGEVPFRRRDFIAAYTAASRADYLGERGVALRGSCSSDGAEPVRVQLEPAPQRTMLTSGAGR